MLIKNTSKLPEMSSSLTWQTAMLRVRPSLWQIVAFASLLAGIGGGWKALGSLEEILSPLPATVTMMLVTFAGWYIWSYFTYLTDQVLFGGHSDYRGTLNAFGRAYVFQALLVFIFTSPLGWMWGWIALYFTVAAWGVIGPRQLGMRTWQAIVAAALGMLLWLACLLILTLTLVWDGLYVGIGVFLV